ncbi:hypothetical protein ACQRET_07610 [Streptomyces koyangensis]|uniref:hypothetical protein n=1 Tax=Streptomyces koyangensis TaxID=188770 RepID=UPI003D020ECF
MATGHPSRRAVAGPQAPLSPLFGRLADRLDRRALWIRCDPAGAAALAPPLWLVRGDAPAPGSTPPTRHSP